jgi:hypothetical protein
MPGRYQPRRPDLSSDGVEHDDLESQQPEPSRQRLTDEFKEGERPSAADAAAAAIRADEAARLQQQRYKTQIEYYDSGLVVRRRIPEGVRGENVVYRKGHSQAGEPYKFGADEMMGRPKDGPDPPRRPFRPPHAPTPTDNDERCPECTGTCNLEGTCEFRERINADDKALKLILQHVAHDPLGSKLRRRRMLLDSFALDGQFPAPWEVALLEEILMRMHQFFKDSQSMADWSRISDTRAEPLSGAERMALYAKQSPRARAHEVILHVAKTEGMDLKELGRMASASAKAVAGGDLYKKKAS